MATAHTANDQAETLLLRLARGTRLHGAAGIRPRRGCYLRPLLCLNRADTEAVCRAAGQTWVTDETNETDAYARNRLRRAALPALQSTNEAATENLARFCEKAAQADAYFAQKAEALLMDARLSDTDPVLLAAGAAGGSGCAHSGNGPAPSGGPGAGPGRKIYPAVGAAGAAGQRSRAADQEGPLPRGRWGAPAGNTGRIRRLGRRCGGRIYRSPAGRKTGPDASAGGKTLTARVFPADFEEKYKSFIKRLKNRADYARITTLYAGLVLRTRQPGDVYRPAGRAVHNRLRKWMNEADIPAQQRDTLPLLAAGSEVLWVCGSGFAEGLAPDETTTQILQMEQET